MNVKSLFATLAILLVTLTFFPSNTVADTESTANWAIELLVIILVLLIVVGVIYTIILLTRKEQTFLKAHRDKLSSDDPKELLELTEKCDEYLKDRNSDEVASLLTQAKTKAAEIQKQIDYQAKLETFKSEESEDGSHPAVVATLKEQMHNPDSFQHVSSNYETVEQEGKRYQKIVMTFRATNTFNALVLQTCYFLVDEDKQITLVGSPDSTEASPVNTVSLAAAADTAVSVVDGVATLADLFAFFTSDEE